ncbi:hypothetical protein FRACYDRAFT_238048 [Fragilariopsis cylindrus CCMP1102]|uniref:SET domain-containing protein n=1 Tax=Fragilariopsis cylindrus CCMP1102 TaxID=635003 RepID=A0A1E7FHM9_9STRA|nr:hypothetical protein FRACYDRAFT_238048 [Fragilariopsis cylindrus CCMP1102]|eukprot:OEU17624.1 hypothetical protein FRACYDRAFT_238048 [Fragilariopsis cylindrus CCMP1102]
MTMMECTVPYTQHQGKLECVIGNRTYALYQSLLSNAVLNTVYFFIDSTATERPRYRRTAIGFLIQNNNYHKSATATISRTCSSIVLSVRRRRKKIHNNVDIVDNDDNDDGDGDTFDTLSELLLQLSIINDVYNTTTSTTINSSSSQQKEQKVARQKEILLSRLDDNNNNNKSSSSCSSSNSTLNIHRTYVAKSQISSAGRGLFACNDYPKGTLLTCYPGDALVDLTTGSITWGSHTTQQRQHSQSKSKSQHSSTSSTTDDDDDGVDVPEEEEINHDYMLRAIHEDWGIVALPELYDNDINNNNNNNNNNDPFDSSSTFASASYLGHFANDGVISPPLCESELAMYVIESNDISNAMHQACQDCHMVTIATKSIKAGDEIFVTYGPEYWSEQPLFGVALHDDDDDVVSEIKTTTTLSSSSTGGGGKGFG